MENDNAFTDKKLLVGILPSAQTTHEYNQSIMR